MFLIKHPHFLTERAIVFDLTMKAENTPPNSAILLFSSLTANQGKTPNRAIDMGFVSNGSPKISSGLEKKSLRTAVIPRLYEPAKNESESDSLNGISFFSLLIAFFGKIMRIVFIIIVKESDKDTNKNQKPFLAKTDDEVGFLNEERYPQADTGVTP